jgi:hypothetical protein
MTQSVFARRTVAKRVVALHYPSVYAPPVGVWWWDEASSGLQQHYLDGHADISHSLAKELAGVATASEWQSRLAKLRQQASASSLSDDRMRTVTTSVWSPVDVLLTTISHWSLRW